MNRIPGRLTDAASVPSPLIELALKSTVILCIAFITVGCVGRRHPYIRSVVWNAVLAALVVLPFAQLFGPRFVVWSEVPGAYGAEAGSASLPDHASDKPQRVTRTARQDGSAGTQDIADSRVSQSVGTIEPRATNVRSHGSSPAAASGLSISQIAGLVVACGMLVGILRLILALLAVERLRRTAVNVTDGVWHKALRQWHAKLGLRKPVELGASDDVHAPVVLGIRRPKILLPRSLVDDLVHEHIDGILAHELAHVRRDDYAWQILLRLLQTIYWYQPLIWLVDRPISASRERACDEFAIHAVGSSHRYAERLLVMAERIITRPRALTLGLAVVRTPQIAQRLREIESSTGCDTCRPSTEKRLLTLGLVLLVTAGIASVVVGIATAGNRVARLRRRRVAQRWETAVTLSIQERPLL